MRKLFWLFIFMLFLFNFVGAYCTLDIISSKDDIHIFRTDSNVEYTIYIPDWLDMVQWENGNQGWVYRQDVMVSWDSECPCCSSNSCPSTWEILSWYILESSINSAYCENNNLCPINTWSVSSGDNWSALYINNLQFPWKSNIFVTIPDYIYWDYSSDESDFNLYVGSGYDQDYIDNIVKINSYQPNSEDFTEIFVGGLTWIMPYIVIVLFIVFVRKLLKRIFK